MIVRNIASRSRANMDSGERSLPTAFFQAILDFHFHIIRRHLRCTIFCCLTQCGLRIIPETVTVGVIVEIRQCTVQCHQCILEICNILSRLNRAKQDSSCFQAADTLISKSRSTGGTSQHNRSGNTAGSEDPSISGIRFVLLIGNGILTVNLTVNDAVPGIGKMPNQFITNLGHIKGNRARHDHCASVVCHPQFMDNCSHQTQHTTSSLESLQCCPITIKSIKDLRMDRIAGDHAIPILHFLGFHGKIGGVILIHLTECFADRIACIRILAIEEKTPANDFKTFISSNRLPNGLHSAKGVFNGFQYLLAGFSANLNFRFRNRRNNQTVLAGTCRFCNLLNEGNEIIIRTCRKSFHAIEFLCIGNQLIHQDKTGTTLIKQVFQVF